MGDKRTSTTIGGIAVAAALCASACSGYWVDTWSSHQRTPRPGAGLQIEADTTLEMKFGTPAAHVQALRCTETVEVEVVTVTRERWRPSGSPGLWVTLGLITAAGGVFPLLGDNKALGGVLVGAGAVQLSYGLGNMIMGVRQRTRTTRRTEPQTSRACPPSLDDATAYTLTMPWGATSPGRARTSMVVQGVEVSKPATGFAIDFTFGDVEAIPLDGLAERLRGPYVLSHPAGLRQTLQVTSLEISLDYVHRERSARCVKEQTVERCRSLCASKVPQACAVMGYLHETGKGGAAKDDGRSVEAYRTGCDGGAAAACTRLGWAYQQGRGVAKDDARAVELYRKGCDGLDGLACAQLAALYKAGQAGLPVDPAQERTYRDLACKRGHRDSCPPPGW